MYSKKINKEIIYPNENNINIEEQINPSFQKEEYNQETDLLVINNEEEPKTNYRYYQKEFYINDDNSQKIINNLKKRTYGNILYEPYKPKNRRVQISNYIYHTERPGSMNNNLRYKSNSKYSIKNPVKEKSKNKLNKNNSENKNACNINKNKKNRNLRLLSDGINNTEIFDYNYDNEEEMININNTNYNFWPGNININNTEYSDNYPIKINLNRKGGNIDLNPKKKQYILYNKRNNTFNNYQPSPRESHISYIYDYSQDKIKNLYNEDSQKFINVDKTYFFRPKLKKKNKADFITFNNKNPKYSDEKLKKKIEKRRLELERIIEIEKKIKNYFNLNGLNIENRELYDQSATMIQSAFRGYYLRMTLYAKINLFVNMKCYLDILKKIFTSKKKNYWDIFLKGIFNYISFIINNQKSSNIIMNKELTGKKFSKKIPNSYRKKAGIKNNKDKNKILIPQSCVSVTINKGDSINKEASYDMNLGLEKNSLEEKLNKILLENEELKNANEKLQNMLNTKINNNLTNNNNIVKNTQESVELKLDKDLNLPSLNNKENNDKLKKNKLKYILSNKIYALKGILQKNFLKFYYISMSMKNAGKIPMVYTKNIVKNTPNNGNEYSFRDKKNDKNNNKRIKKLKNILLKNDLKIKNSVYNKFIVFYFKGLISQLQNNNDNNNENKNNDDKDIDNKNVEDITNTEKKEEIIKDENEKKNDE